MNKQYRYFLMIVLGGLSLASHALATSLQPPAAREASSVDKPMPYQLMDKPIRKSERDARHYQAIRLANGMSVLLVSDDKATKSLAALAIPVGSLDDPDSQLGLAHYLEHMLLMGSKSYPEPDGFSQFLSKHGGSHNASTASYRTAFYLEVEHDAFSDAVKRLSDAIAHPRLDPNYADRERNAVNAELTMARTRDGMRMGQVDSETLNPQHPTSRFSGGNLLTLSDKPGSKLQDELTQFYQRYYSANLMVGVLYSNLSINDLASMAVETFGKIDDRQAQVAAITVPVATENEKGIIIHYTPAQPRKQLRIDFRIDNNTDRFRSKTDTYIGYLIGNRGENTLSDWLQKQGLIENIGAGADPMSDRNGGKFVIAATLTDKGVANRDLVTAAIFNYLELIKSRGIRQDYFAEIARVLELDFRYLSVSRDMNYVENLSDTLLRLPVEHVLDGDYLADKFDPKEIEARLHQMTPENARVWFISPDEPSNKRAYFVDAPYQVEKISAARLDLWRQSEKTIRLSLPSLNPYIPDSFATVNATDRLDKPEWIVEGESVRAMFMPSRYFADEPKASVMVALRNENAQKGAQAQVLSSLTSYIANLALDRLKYQASIGGINFSVSENNGLVFSANGFTQRLPKLLAKLIADYQHVAITESDLGQAKSWYLQQLDAAEKVSAYELALQPLTALNRFGYTERDDRRTLIDSITIHDVQQYRDDLLRQSTPEVIAVGNFTAHQVENMATSAQKRLATKGRNWWHGQDIVLDKALKANFARIGSSTDSALAAFYIPLEYKKVEGQAYSSLLAQILHPWFFKQLRTEEQLGYALFVFPTSLGEQWGVGFLLQSNSRSPAYLYERYLAFYQQADRQLAEMSEADFAQYKQGLINDIQQHPQTLSEEASRYLGDFARSNYQFDSRARLVKAIESIDKTQLRQFFKAAVLDQTGLAAISQIMGNQDRKAPDYARPENWPEYKTASGLQKRFNAKVRP